jgi:hypothetical protein
MTRRAGSDLAFEDYNLLHIALGFGVRGFIHKIELTLLDLGLT